MAGPYPHEESDAICAKAGLDPKKHTKAHAVAVLLGQTGNVEYVGGLNQLAGNPKTAYRDHEGVLNQLAGTVGWGANAAASRYAGLY